LNDKYDNHEKRNIQMESLIEVDENYVYVEDVSRVDRNKLSAALKEAAVYAKRYGLDVKVCSKPDQTREEFIDFVESMRAIV
jgi:hypothetical protein